MSRLPVIIGIGEIKDHPEDRRCGVAPELLRDYAGPASVETHTVIYGRGVPSHGVVIARTPSGARLMARVKGTDRAGIAALERW